MTDRLHTYTLADDGTPQGGAADFGVEPGTARWHAAQQEALTMAAQASKYHARVTWVDGIRFASGMEARRYQELRLLLAAGVIADLECQPRFPLVVNGADCGCYVGDFRYTDLATGQVVTEDVKGFRTDVFALKKKLVRALYAVEIVEVKA